MPNKNQPIGFEPFGEVLRASEYTAASVIYPGDLVTKDASGKVKAAAATEAAMGVALSYAAADGAKVLLADHPDQRFIVQADDATIDAQTDIGLNADIVAGTASTKYKRSGMQLDAATVAATQALVIKVQEVLKRIDNELGDKVDVVVSINQHQLAHNTAGV